MSRERQQCHRNVCTMEGFIRTGDRLRIQGQHRNSGCSRNTALPNPHNIAPPHVHPHKGNMTKSDKQRLSFCPVTCETSNSTVSAVCRVLTQIQAPPVPIPANPSTRSARHVFQLWLLPSNARAPIALCGFVPCRRQSGDRCSRPRAFGNGRCPSQDLDRFSMCGFWLRNGAPRVR